jgi:menaquinone-9 beta-reductase
MNSSSWDVAVIGGGPAGCSAAISLAQKGFRVTLLEAKTYPHDKMCGEFLSPECAGLLSRLGLAEKIESLHPAPISKAVLTAPDGASWETTFPIPALGISRKTLDASLAEYAQQVGVQLREAVVVSGLSGNLREGFTLETRSRNHSERIHTSTVIGAYGKRSVLDRILERKFYREDHAYLAFKAHFHGPRIPGRIELHAFPGGYCGLSEIEDGSQVACFLVHRGVFQQHGGRQAGIEPFVHWMCSKNLFLQSWFHWAERIHERWISIAQVPFSRKPLITQDVLMTGDAAGLIAPLAGNGISMALDGGMMAASYLGCYLSGEMSLSNLLVRYPLTWRKKFGVRLNLGRLLQPITLNPRLVSLTLRLFSAAPSLGRLMVMHTRSG